MTSVMAFVTVFVTVFVTAYVYVKQVQPPTAYSTRIGLHGAGGL